MAEAAAPPLQLAPAPGDAPAGQQGAAGVGGAPAAAAVVVVGGGGGAVAAAPAEQQRDPPADGEDGEEPAAKRARPSPDFTYFPEEVCDLVLKTADGKRLGVHRLIVLRTCAFLKDLLEACTDASEVVVAETCTQLRSQLLDFIYDRSVQIKPAEAMQVFRLADKYQAPQLMEACRGVFASDAFKLGIPSAAAAGQWAVPGHAPWTDMLATASKHTFSDVFDKCMQFLKDQSEKQPAALLLSLLPDSALLSTMRPGDVKEFLHVLAQAGLGIHSRGAQEQIDLHKKIQQGQTEAEELHKKGNALDHQRSSYLKLLGKYNRLVDRCKKAKVNWPQELEEDERQKQARKGRRKRGGGGGGGAAAAAGAAAPAAAAPPAAAAAAVAAAAPAAAAPAAAPAAAAGAGQAVVIQAVEAILNNVPVAADVMEQAMAILNANGP